MHIVDSYWSLVIRVCSSCSGVARDDPAWFFFWFFFSPFSSFACRSFTHAILIGSRSRIIGGTVASVLGLEGCGFGHDLPLGQTKDISSVDILQGCDFKGTVTFLNADGFRFSAISVTLPNLQR